MHPGAFFNGNASSHGSPVLGTALFVLISFGILIFVIRVFAWKNIVSIMAERKTKIETDLQTASQKRHEAEEAQRQSSAIIQEAKQTAGDILTEARDNASRLQKELEKTAREDIDKMKQVARYEIEAMRKKALAEMESEVAEISIALASQILNRELTLQEHHRLIHDFIEELEKA